MSVNTSHLLLPVILSIICMISSTHSRQPNQLDFDELNNLLECGFVRTQYHWNFQTYSDSSVSTFNDQNTPLAVVMCSCQKDVTITMKWYQAFLDTTPFRVRSGGHSMAGYSSSLNAIVIDLSRLKSIQILNDIQLTIEPGIHQWEYEDWKLLPQNNQFTQTFPHGICPDVGFGGFLQGGGVGLTTPQWAVASDYIFGVHVILCDGSLWKIIENDCSQSKCIDECINENQYTCAQLQELLFAIKGSGGGNWGIITKYYLNTLPEPNDIKFFALSFPIVNQNDVENAFIAYKNVLTDSYFLQQEDKFGFVLQFNIHPRGENNKYSQQFEANFQCIYFPDHTVEKDIFLDMINKIEQTMGRTFVDYSSNITTTKRLSEIYKYGVYPRWSIDVLRRFLGLDFSDAVDDLLGYPFFTATRLIEIADDFTDEFINILSERLYEDIISRNNWLGLLRTFPGILLEKIQQKPLQKESSFPRKSRNAWSNLSAFVTYALLNIYRDDAKMIRDEWEENVLSLLGDDKYINYVDDITNDLTFYYDNTEIERLKNIQQIFDVNQCFSFEIGINGGCIGENGNGCM